MEEVQLANLQHGVNKLWMWIALKLLPNKK